MEKIDHYIQASWWQEKNVPHASPLLCIPKKDRRLHTVVDCCEHNLNTVKDLMPFLDQDMIHSDIAQAPYQTKLNMSDAYEQVRVEPGDIKNTAFSMIVGMFFLSHIVQQGDCNAPATFQRLIVVKVALPLFFLLFSSHFQYFKHLLYYHVRPHVIPPSLSATYATFITHLWDCQSHCRP